MAHRRDQNWPAWLELVETPGVVDVLAALHQNSPSRHARLCAGIASVHASTVTATALRLLAVHQLLRQHRGAGSLDDPEPGIRWELTDRGHEFAQLYDQLVRLVSARDPGSRPRTLRRR